MIRSGGLRHFIAAQIALLIAFVIAWPIARDIEGDWLPVVTPLEVIEVEPIREGVLVLGEFRKLRSCEFIGVHWYATGRAHFTGFERLRGLRPREDLDGIRLVLEFSPLAALLPESRPMGPQVVGPWLLRGISGLAGTYATAVHRCHPFWLTYSAFYIGADIG